MQYREADFWPSYSKSSNPAALPTTYGDRKYTTPRFQLKVNFMMDNHSLAINSSRDVVLRKNTIAASGITGLVRDDRGLPKQGGLLARPSGASKGSRAVTGRQGGQWNQFGAGNLRQVFQGGVAQPGPHHSEP